MICLGRDERHLLTIISQFPLVPGAWWRGMSRVHTVQRWGHGWGGVAILSPSSCTICVHRACDGRYGLHQVYQQVSSVTIMYTLSILYTARWRPGAVRAACVRAHNSQLPRVRNLALSVVTGSPPHLSTHCSQHTLIRTSGYPHHHHDQPRTRVCPRPGSDLCVQVCTETTASVPLLVPG